MLIISVHSSVRPCVRTGIVCILSSGSGISVDRDVIPCEFLLLLKLIFYLHNLINMGI